jgi:hypothetical protein
MAPRKKKIEEINRTDLEQVHAVVEKAMNPGIVKEYVQNGLRYRRIRTEKGELIDVRI